MICPKCKKELQEQGIQCPHCGIYFAKYAQYHATENSQSDKLPGNIKIYGDDEIADAEMNPLAALFFADAQRDSSLHLVWRGIVFIGLTVWGWLIIFSYMDDYAFGEGFLHLINTPFHEAGHVIFRPFGSFMHSLGGTLGQLLMPLICMGTLLIKTRDPFGASVCLWWFGENFLDIAPYMADARALEQPLLGGNVGYKSPYGFHDWEYLLTEIDMIEYDIIFAKISYVFGSIIMLLSLIWAGYLLFKQYRAIR
jgi:hypothetical protein